MLFVETRNASRVLERLGTGLRRLFDAGELGRRGRFAFAMACLLATLGFSGAALGDDGRAEEKKALLERVHARWQAIMKLDYDRVYEFATPAYRSAHSLTHFKNQYGAQVQRKEIEVREVNFDRDDPSVAKVGLLLVFETSGVSGPVFEGTSRVDETWVKQDGQWWIVEER